MTGACRSPCIEGRHDGAMTEASGGRRCGATIPGDVSTNVRTPVTEDPALPGSTALPAMPPAASLGGAIRSALGDLYEHSWRLVPANIVWSIVAVAVLFAAVVAPIGLLLVPLLAFPTAGLFRMTTRIARGDAVSFWDSIAAWRRDALATLLLGGALSLAAVVLSVNFVSGILTQTVIGWAFATLAFWGLVAAWLIAWTAWPILADPHRDRWPARERARLAARVVLAHPIALAVLGVLLLAFLVASAVAIVAILTVSVALAALIAARYVLPAADRLDAQLGFGARRGLATGPQELDPTE